MKVLIISYNLFFFFWECKLIVCHFFICRVWGERGDCFSWWSFNNGELPVEALPSMRSEPANSLMFPGRLWEWHRNCFKCQSGTSRTASVTATDWPAFCFFLAFTDSDFWVLGTVVKKLPCLFPLFIFGLFMTGYFSTSSTHVITELLHNFLLIIVFNRSKWCALICAHLWQGRGDTPVGPFYVVLCGPCINHVVQE